MDNLAAGCAFDEFREVYCMVRKIIYAVVILAALGGYVMFDGTVLLAAACFLTLLAIILLSTLFLQKRKFRIETVGETDFAEQGGRAEVSFLFINQSIFPVARAVVQFQLYDSRGLAAAEKKRTDIQLKGRSELRFSCRVPSEHCGVRIVRTEKIRLYDFLQIFSTSIPVPQPVELYIFPQIRQVELIVKGEWTDSGTAESDDTGKGDDPSVTYQIREYQPGDSMRGIHWKLSARTEEWVVREYGRTLSHPRVLLRLAYRTQGVDPVHLDGFYAAAGSLMNTFCKYGMICKTVWEEGEKEQSFLISGEEDLYETIRRLVKSNGAKEKTDAGRPAVRWEQERELLLDMDRRLWDGNRCIAEFPPPDSDGEKWETLGLEL